MTDFKAIIDLVDESIINRTLGGTITYWNRGAERLFGYAADEMIGKPISILIPPELEDEESEMLRRVAAGEQLDSFLTQGIRKDGSIIEIALTYVPLRNSSGRVTAISGIARNISEHQRLELAQRDQSFLDAIVSSASDAVISKDLNGIVTSWNPAAERLFGYSAEEMIGQPVAILIPPDHSDEEPHILERIRRGERIDHYETKRVRKDGRIVDVSLTVSPIKDRSGKILGASKIARDISQQKLGEQRESDALRQAQLGKKQAEVASLAKDEFLATISHELRTPLTAILGWIRMLSASEIDPETYKRAVASIERNAKSQSKLIEDLLDISRIVSGKLRIVPRLTDLPLVIDAAVAAVRLSADAKNIQIQIVTNPSAVPLLGDFQRLQQVVWNLLSNAIRFTPIGGLVKVELTQVEGQIELRVSDNGLGIEPAFLPYVFDRFAQADSSTTRAHTGLGMGLAIVKSIVELHGGVVAVASPGKDLGTVFTVHLPVRTLTREPAEPARSQPTGKEVFPEAAELVGLKILFVDDQPDTCELMRFIFTQCGAIVETAASAAAALVLFDSWAPDIMVSDIAMADMNGYQLIRTIRNDRKSRMPAIALTAMARTEDRDNALNAGYQMHVAKPVEPAELMSLMASLAEFVERSNP